MKQQRKKIVSDSSFQKGADKKSCRLPFAQYPVVSKWNKELFSAAVG